MTGRWEIPLFTSLGRREVLGSDTVENTGGELWSSVCPCHFQMSALLIWMCPGVLPPPSEVPSSLQAQGGCGYGIPLLDIHPLAVHSPSPPHRLAHPFPGAAAHCVVFTQPAGPQPRTCSPGRGLRTRGINPFLSRPWARAPAQQLQSHSFGEPGGRLGLTLKASRPSFGSQGLGQFTSPF